MVRLGWLRQKDVDTRTGDNAFGKRDRKVLLDVYPAARGVDEVRRRFHLLEERKGEHPERLLGAGTMHRNEIRSRKQLLDAHLGGALCLYLGGTQVRIIGKNAHAKEVLAQRRGARADLSYPDDTKRLATQIGPLDDE